MTEITHQQQDTRLAKFYRRATLVYMAVVAFVTLIYAFINIKIKANWAIGDWLINYRGGFVRRGLTGEIALRLSHLLSVSPLIIVALLQLFFYAVILYAVWKLLAKTNWSLWLVLLIFSPATLAFHVLDPTAGSRKEIILFAGLGVLLLWLLHGAKHYVAIVVYLTALCTSCVLSHEALIVFLPYTLAALLICMKDVAQVLKFTCIPVIVTLLATYSVVHHPGNQASADTICASLSQPVTMPLSGLCGGAIQGLAYSTAMARQDVIDYERGFHYSTLYSITGLLALLPVLLAFATLWRYPALRRNLTVLAGAALISGLASSILFVYATDWGRWIYIHVFCIFLILLVMDYKRQSDPTTVGPEPVLTTSRAKNMVIGTLILIYVFCWDLPHVGLYSGRFGYFGLIQYFVHYRQLHPHL